MFSLLIVVYIPKPLRPSVDLICDQKRYAIPKFFSEVLFFLEPFISSNMNKVMIILEFVCVRLIYDKLLEMIYMYTGNPFSAIVKFHQTLDLIT